MRVTSSANEPTNYVNLHALSMDGQVTDKNGYYYFNNFPF